jgi:hypothetical protein
MVSVLTKLQRFALYMRPEGLLDTCLDYIMQNSGNIQYMLLCNIRDSDIELVRLAIGCSNLWKLELRSCYFRLQRASPVPRCAPDVIIEVHMGARL